MNILSQRKMPFWDVEIGNVELTSMLNKYIEGISVKYAVDDKGVSVPDSAEIRVNSPAFIEDYFTEGVPVKIYFGYHFLDKRLMFKGEIKDIPQGMIQETTGYSLICGGEALSMTKETKTRNDFPPFKDQIVKIVIAMAGYTPVVDISDTRTIDIDKIPIQKNETDLEFLARLAKQWNCLWWLSGDNFYFVDCAKAHDQGDLDINRKRSADDYLKEYQLYFRYALGKNNVAKITWKKKDTQGGGPGTPGVGGANESGETTSVDDFKFPDKFKGWGKIYEMKPKVLEIMRNDPILAEKYTILIATALNKGVKSEIEKYYYVPVVHNSGQHEDQSHTPEHKRFGYELDVELVKGDPGLRAPRTAKLSCGTLNDKYSYLPQFLFYSGKSEVKYNINEVEHSLNGGMLQTKLKMTA